MTDRNLQRARVIRLWKSGATVRQMRLAVNVGDDLIKQWVGAEKERLAQRVITPAPFRRGYRWWAGW